MIDRREIERTIDELERAETTFPVCAKLADLYVIRGELEAMEFGRGYSSAAGPVANYGDSDFLRSVAGKDQGRAWLVMDELMDTLNVANPKIYNSVMQKLEKA